MLTVTVNNYKPLSLIDIMHDCAIIALAKILRDDTE